MSETKIGSVRARGGETASPGTSTSLGGFRHVLVRDLVLACEIGALRHERGARQRVRINLDLSAREEPAPIADDLRNVVCYDEVVSAIRRLTAAGHMNLVETLAERIAELCLADARVRIARVRVEKLDVYPDAGSVGVEIERFNPLP
jgi:7,8-dihydroneopterin aldolase/epimerase/oxygenase